MDVLLWVGMLTAVALLTCLVVMVSIPIVLVVCAIVDDWQIKRWMRKKGGHR